jgi:hypothetical protein
VGYSSHLFHRCLFFTVQQRLTSPNMLNSLHQERHPVVE